MPAILLAYIYTVGSFIFVQSRTSIKDLWKFRRQIADYHFIQHSRIGTNARTRLAFQFIRGARCSVHTFELVSQKSKITTTKAPLENRMWGRKKIKIDFSATTQMRSTIEEIQVMTGNKGTYFTCTLMLAMTRWIISICNCRCCGCGCGSFIA